MMMMMINVMGLGDALVEQTQMCKTYMPDFVGSRDFINTCRTT
jgi:hypothetical protein